MQGDATTGRTRHQASARYILPVLVFSALVMSIIATLGTPMVPTISRELDVSLETAQWLLTVTLLVGAVATPIGGRLADGSHRKLVVAGALAIVFLGSVIAATIRYFPAFLFGRALQGVGLAIVPMAIAVARDTMPRQRAREGIALLSVTTAIGTGLGYPMTGLLGDRFGYQVPYTVAALTSLVAVVLIWRTVPPFPSDRSSPLDVPGALLLSLALVCLLLTISQGRRWGWASPPILALTLGAIVFGALWVLIELRVRAPLVEVRLTLNRLVMSANVTTFLMGVGLFAVSSLVSRFVQTPESAEYGFHAGLFLTGLMLMPLSVGTMLSTWFTRWLNARIEPFLVLPIGAGIVALTALFLALVRDEPWQMMLALGVFGLGIGTTVAAMPGLIIRAVLPQETGSATGLNAVLRSTGGSIGSAASIALLSSYTPLGRGCPPTTATRSPSSPRQLPASARSWRA